MLCITTQVDLIGNTTTIVKKTIVTFNNERKKGKRVENLQVIVSAVETSQERQE
jgi:hypothetical protein